MIIAPVLTAEHEGKIMNLLFNRDQKSASLFTLVPLRFGSGVMFQLHAELELDEEEKQLMQKYRFANAALVLSDPIEDIKRAFRPAMLLGIITFVLILMLSSFTTALSLSILVMLVMTVVYFRTERELILVNHLLDGGRTFYCDSIIKLIEKEAYLEYISEYLRQVLESAKHWHDRETLPIKPLDKESAKQAVLKMLHG